MLDVDDILASPVLLQRLNTTDLRVLFLTGDRRRDKLGLGIPIAYLQFVGRNLGIPIFLVSRPGNRDTHFLRVILPCPVFPPDAVFSATWFTSSNTRERRGRPFFQLGK